MEVQVCLQARRSIRKFTDEAVSGEQIDALLHAAMSGPSACNARPWAFYVVANPEALEKLRAATPYTRMRAPLAIVVCGDQTRTLPDERAQFWIQDCSAATENILLAATDLGLGTVWCGIHPKMEAEENVRAALALPGTMIPLNIIYAGHPAEQHCARDQYDEKCVHFV